MSEVTNEVCQRGKGDKKRGEESEGVRRTTKIEKRLALPSQAYHLTLELVQT